MSTNRSGIHDFADVVVATDVTERRASGDHSTFDQSPITNSQTLSYPSVDKPEIDSRSSRAHISSASNEPTFVRYTPNEKSNWSNYRANKYTCNHCSSSESFSNWKIFAQHLWVEHGVKKPFECESCGHFFSRKDNLEKHKEMACKMMFPRTANKQANKQSDSRNSTLHATQSATQDEFTIGEDRMLHGFDQPMFNADPNFLSSPSFVPISSYIGLAPLEKYSVPETTESNKATTSFGRVLFEKYSVPETTESNKSTTSSNTDLKRDKLGRRYKYVCQHKSCMRSLDTFLTKREYTLHLDKVHGIKYFKCGTCSVAFNREDNYRTHLKKTSHVAGREGDIDWGKDNFSRQKRSVDGNPRSGSLALISPRDEIVSRPNNVPDPPPQITITYSRDIEDVESERTTTRDVQIVALRSKLRELESKDRELESIDREIKSKDRTLDALNIQFLKEDNERTRKRVLHLLNVEDEKGGDESLDPLDNYLRKEDRQLKQILDAILSIDPEDLVRRKRPRLH